MTEQQLDRKDLKIQALLERLSSTTAEKESQIADLRVEITVQSSESRLAIEELNNRIMELEAQIPKDEEKSDDDSEA